MRLRTKLLLSFTTVILLAGIIAYTGYTALQVMENYQTQSSSCNTAQSCLLEGRISGSNFLLYKKPELLVPLSKSLKQAVDKLKTVRSIAHSKENQDACTALIALIEQSEKNYLNLGKSHQQFLDSQKKLVEATKKAILSAKETSNRLGETGHDAMAAALLAEFYELRILIYRFELNPDEEKVKAIQAPFNSFIADGKKHLPEFVADYKIYNSLKKLIADMEAYQKAGKDFTSSILTFQADIPKTAKVVHEAGEKIDTLLARVLKNQKAKQERFKNILLLVTLVVLCLGLGIAFLLTRNVLSQLGRDPGVLVSATQKIMAGDFNINDKGPKIGVYGTFVDMVRNLEDNIEEAQRQTKMAKEESEKAQEATQRAEEAQRAAERAKRDGMLHAAEQLEGIVAVVSSASEQLSAQIEQSSRGAEEQAQRMSETATAMEEMNGAVLEVARNSGQASELSAQAREKAQVGAKIVQETGSSMTTLQQQSEVLKADMNELDEHATSISQIMGVISDIADQTNLLALNAAIEAARAGEAGRGFAVVADEVRKLAEKTMDSTADVSKAITEIQESATKNIRQMERTGTIVEEVMKKAQQASSALSEIVTLVDESSDQVRAIATASEEQSATSDEINRSVTEVNTISGETSQAMREAAQAVTELSKQAQELSALIQNMKNS